MNRVLVLNATNQPLNTTSVRRAIKMIFLRKAEVVIHNGLLIRTPRLVFAVPSVIRLMNFIHVPHRQVPLTRKYILVRDGFTCQYCGRQETRHMTIDHVIPRSRGGESTWGNLVCACKECNNRKNNRALADANMTLMRMPRKPSPQSLLLFSLLEPPPEWLPYLE
ncbi:MAG: HNH endonuclease [Candidatus Eremiobacteraeota bacterium]|nr:HNH endonuclease [Candidatus Eremiobacteraeota bacterium]